MMHHKDHELPVKESFQSLQLGRQHFYNELKTNQILDQPIISLEIAVGTTVFYFWVEVFGFCLVVSIYVSVIEMNGR